jgi:TRAP-type transport system periplasmic protein
MNKIVLGVAVAAIGLVAGRASAETIQVAHAFAQPALPSQMDEYFASQLEKATDGKTTLQFFWGGSLGGGGEILHLIRDGAIQIGATVPGYYGSEMPVTGLFNSLPFLSPDGNKVRDLQDELSRTNPVYLAEYQKMGVFPILQHALTASHLMCTRPVENLNDLAGLKIRTYGQFLPIAVEALGAVPVNMGLGDVYEGLQRGVVQCVTINYAAAKAFKFDEVAKFWSTINLGAISGPVLYTSYKNYKEGGWTPDFVAMVDAAARDAVAKERGLAAEADEVAVAEAIAGGVQLIEFVDQEAADGLVPDMLSLWRDEQVKNGLDAAVADEVVAAARESL